MAKQRIAFAGTGVLAASLLFLQLLMPAVFFGGLYWKRASTRTVFYTWVKHWVLVLDVG